MTKDNSTRTHEKSKRRSIIEMDGGDARSFLLKQESYCTIDLPPYITFDNLLEAVANVLKDKQLSTLRCKNPRDYDNVNHVILYNKDGRYAWRPFELIHPALYVSLVKTITEPAHWKSICDRFRTFINIPEVQCLSIPVESLSGEKDKAEQVGQWWEDFEQKSIELSLDYQFMVQTDIVDCYAAIYTHSIAWALHTKALAKEKRRDKSLIGNLIDEHIQDMRQGQTNGIPQGSVLMDLVAELVLGYADAELVSKIKAERIENYHILRYRDDYRIFVNNPQDGETILKCLTEVLIDLGLKLGPGKTVVSGDVISSSIKPDKLNWMFRKQAAKELQRHLLIIRNHGASNPNSGSLVVALQDYHKRLTATEKCEYPLPLIAIVTDIAFSNPRTYAIAAAILSHLLSFLRTAAERRDVIQRIRRKFSRIPNTGYLEIWLQRISFRLDPQLDFNEPLCRVVRQESEEIWNRDWISSRDLRKAVDPKSIVNGQILAGITSTIPIKEIKLFLGGYD